MWLTRLALQFIFLTHPLEEFVMAKEAPKVIRTYMSFGLPVDPADVKTLVDLDLSYALASTLSDWSPTRELGSGLAETWESVGEKEILFKLRPNAKWSDGEPLTAQQVVRSFERAKRTQSDALKSLFDVVLRIEAKGAHSVMFVLNRSVSESGIVRKLTEPMYGIVYVKNDGSIDPSKSVGPFFLKSAGKSEIRLAVNKFWHGHDRNMADEVIIRQPPNSDGFQENPIPDEWPNLEDSSSLMETSVAENLKQHHYSIWNRNLDKIFFFSPSPRLANAEGRKLFQALAKNLNRDRVTKGLSGYHFNHQFFPPGYVLFDPEFQPLNETPAVPSEFKKRPLEILGTDARLGRLLRDNIKAAIKEITGIEPHLKLVPLNKFEETRVAGNYDFVAASIPVNDPNADGAMSFFFGLTPSIIPSAGEGAKNFKARVSAAGKLEDSAIRNREYRAVMAEATREGCVLPLFHFSTIVVAKDGMDLSMVPTTDETVAFAKVRFK